MREPKKDELLFTGVVTDVKQKPTCSILTMKDPKAPKGKTSKSFRVFDTLGFEVLNLSKGEPVKILYKQTKNSITRMLYNKVLDFERSKKKETRKKMSKKDTNKNGRYTSGTITSLNSSRGSVGKHKDEICFTLKQLGNRVIYCYCSKELSQSDWFKKGQNLVMEVLEENRGITDHTTYKVITFWGKV